MNKRFCKLGNLAAKAFFLTAICGVTYSCKDDYTLDDTTPSWLGSSIYEYLEEDGNYTNFVKLINDLEYKEVLARTGSKTLFVANDDAFKSFYSNNPWGVTSYDQLTASQKRILLNGSMINNAYLLEMMSSTPAGGGDNDVPKRGECMRRETAFDVTDTIPHLFGEELPVNYSSDEKEKDYWARFREKGIYLALDGTPSMMVHFINTQLANKQITDKDFEIITGIKRDNNDVFIFNNKVIKQDITCQNGYVNVLDKVNIAPQNMAEVLRTNKNTKIFSHMMDRFSAPFYNEELTARARLNYGNQVDSVFEKRYFALRSQGNEALFSDAGTDPTNNPRGNAIFDDNSNRPLPFDPGWNQYAANTQTTASQDMGVIFCPNDKKLMEYFFAPGAGGNFLVKAYAGDLINDITPDTEDLEKVFRALDCIPRSVIRALVSNLMKDSFVSSVPSKFETIKNSAQDPMFDNNDDYHRKNIQEVLIANNGIIYVMNEVTTPAEYAAVSAPAYVEQDKKIFNWAVQAKELAGIPTNYYAYLLAMSSRFSFFVPQDKDFTYIDPMSFYSPEIKGNTLVGRAYKFEWKDKNKPEATTYECNYDLATKTCVLGDKLTSSTVSDAVIGNRLKDMLETHTVIHEDNTATTGINETETGMECNKHYYLTKNGAAIYVDKADRRKNGMTIKGGWLLNGIGQIEPVSNSNLDYCSVIGFDDKSAQSNGYGNGFAYMIDEPIQPAIESVYSILNSNKNFSKFFDLCQPSSVALDSCGIDDTASRDKFTIFSNRGGIPCYNADGSVASSATNVRFFNNYNYTVYVPTNEAMDEAFAKGLPTWEEVEALALEDYELDGNGEPRTAEQIEKLTAARNEKVLAMSTAIINFVRNHFQDNSVFADLPKMNSSVFETATLNTSGVYSKVSVSSEGATSLANAKLSIKDANGHVSHTTNDKNLIARDYITAKGASITSSSSAVIHGIDHVLDYKTLTNGRYDSDWSTTARARKYLSKYRLTK